MGQLTGTKRPPLVKCKLVIGPGDGCVCVFGGGAGEGGETGGGEVKGRGSGKTNWNARISIRSFSMIISKGICKRVW